MNFGVLFLPSMLFMAVLFISQGMADDVWSEKEDGTLRRAAVLPHSLTWFLAGKLAAAGVIMAAVGVAVLGVLAAMGAVTISRMPAALLWVVFGGTALYCVFQALQVLASSRRGAHALSNVVIFPMMMIGGAFFPFEAMPAWMRAVGAWTPNGLALVRFKEIIAGTATSYDVLGSALAIGLPATMLFLLSARLAGGRFASRD
jgi:ABC-type multidrug transport system permease subunit